jgi:HAD superfamily hydrolase (TIGR01509 family)
LVGYNTGPAVTAVIFDFDGLILDTEGPAFQSWQEIYREFGCTLPLSIWERVLGGHSGAPVICEYLESLLDRPVDRDDVLGRRRARNLELTAAEAILPGVYECIAEAKAFGVALGLASSSGREWVTSHLERLGLGGAFDCMRFHDDVSNVKPDPELYLSVLNGLGVAADDAIAFEDSPNGVTAAARAGIFCVAVPNKLTAQLSLDHADLALPSLDAIPLGELLRIAASSRRKGFTPSARPGTA